MKRLRNTSFQALLIVASILCAGVSGVAQTAEGPVQPIDFSHRIHAGDNKISCLYCHTGANRSISAGVPSVGTCAECHRFLKLKSPEIQKVLKYWETKQPITWTRVYSVPDYVYFSHKRHVRAGVACQSCHGEVQQVDRVSQQSSLTMGWCLQCHEQRQAPRECDTCHK